MTYCTRVNTTRNPINRPSLDHYEGSDCANWW